MIFCPKFRQLLLTSASLCTLFCISAAPLKAMDEEDENKTNLSGTIGLTEADKAVQKALRCRVANFKDFVSTLQQFYPPLIAVGNIKPYFKEFKQLEAEKNLVVQAAVLKRIIDLSVDSHSEPGATFKQYKAMIELLQTASSLCPDAQSAVKIALMAGGQAYELENYMKNPYRAPCFSESQSMARASQAAEVWWNLAENPQLDELPEGDLPSLPHNYTLASDIEKQLDTLGNMGSLRRLRSTHLPEKDTHLTLFKAICYLRAGEDYLSLFSWPCKEQAVETTSSSSSSSVLSTESTSKTLQQSQSQSATFLDKAMLALTKATKHTATLSDMDSNPLYALQYAMLALDIQRLALKPIRSSYTNEEKSAKIIERETETKLQLIRTLSEKIIEKYDQFNANESLYKGSGEIARLCLAKAHFHLGMIASAKAEKMTHWQEASNIAEEALSQFRDSTSYSPDLLHTFKYDGGDVIHIKELKVPFWHEAINCFIDQETQKN